MPSIVVGSVGQAGGQPFLRISDVEVVQDPVHTYSSTRIYSKLARLRRLCRLSALSIHRPVVIEPI